MRCVILLATVVACLVSSGCSRPAGTPAVVLITIDTLRADHLGVYGYQCPISPHIDALARQSTLFENAVSQAPHTIPSVLQIMTSRYAQWFEIPADTPTLAEVLQKRGYQTFAVVENPHFAMFPDALGLRRGFDRFYRNGVLARNNLEQQLYKTNTAADAVTAQTLRVLRGRERGRPFFLWVHYFDPHDPYLPPFADDMDQLSQLNPSPYTGDVRATPLFERSPTESTPLGPADRQHLIDLYDAEIRYVDQSIGDLLGFLSTERLFDGALVILSSDHGESLGEHGTWTHGRTCFEPEIHVPLLVKMPHAQAPVRRREAVQTIDIFPTVVDALQLPVEGLHLDGHSLLHAHGIPAFVFWRDWQVVRSADWKLVQQGERSRLYQIAQDPGEETDELAEHPEVARDLLAAREEAMRAHDATAADLKRQSDATAERLRALGYLAH